LHNKASIWAGPQKSRRCSAVIAPAQSYGDPITGERRAASGALVTATATSQRRSKDLPHTPIYLLAVPPDIGAGLLHISPRSDANCVHAAGLKPKGVYRFVHARHRQLFRHWIFGMSVAFNFEAIYVACADAANGRFFDWERVEVLSGASGVRCRRDATNGAVNLRSCGTQSIR
jgi:hypothetical protein